VDKLRGIGSGIVFRGKEAFMADYNHVIPANMLVQIGDMTVSFGHLEFHMQEILIYLLDQSTHMGRAVASYLSFKRLRAALSTLFEQCFGTDELLLELRELLKQAASVEQERNAITHSAWMGSYTPLNIRRFKVTGHEKGGYKKQFEEYSEDRLLEFNERIKNLTSKFIDFRKRLPAKVPDSTS
jgi:hypothetical protein